MAQELSTHLYIENKEKIHFGCTEVIIAIAGAFFIA